MLTSSCEGAVLKLRSNNTDPKHYNHISNRASKYLYIIYPEVIELKIEFKSDRRAESYATIKNSKAKIVIAREAHIDVIFNHEIAHILFHVVATRPDRQLLGSINSFYELIKQHGIVRLLSESNYLTYPSLGHPEDSPSEMFASLYNLLMLLNSTLISNIQREFIRTNLKLLSNNFPELNRILKQIQHYMPEIDLKI